MASNTLRNMMKAIRVAKFGGPEAMVLKTDVPIPKPDENQVLVRVYAAGVNPVDTYLRSGNYAVLPALPYTPGRDGAGVVEDAGSNVKNIKKGDRVYTVFSATGSYAQYMLCDPKCTFKLNDTLSFEAGATLGIPYFTAYKALVMRATHKPGDTLLVHGASGAVGLAACQIGQILGLRVLGTAGTVDGLDLVRQTGAEAVFNHREPNYIDDIKALTGDKGVTVILEMLADVNLVKDCQLISPRGTIVVVGCRGSLDFSPRLTMGKEINISGVNLAVSTPDDFAEIGAFLAGGQKQGWLKPCVGLKYSLEEAQEAHKEVIAHNQGTKGKIVLTVS